MDPFADAQPHERVLVAGLCPDDPLRLDGVESAARSLRDAGCEVVYLGATRSPKGVVAAAIDEDVDAIVVWTRSAAGLDDILDVLARLTAEAVEIPVIVGGVGAGSDAEALANAGATPLGTDGVDEVAAVVQAAGRRRQM